MQKYTKVRPDTFETLQLNAGIILDDFDPSDGSFDAEDLVGATTGGIQFATNPTYTDFGEDIDNVPANTKELKHVTGYDPQMSGTFLPVTAGLAAKLVGAADIDPTDETHIVPRGDLEDSDFTDLWFVGDYSDVNTGEDAGFLAIHIKNTLNTTGFQMQTEKNQKGKFAFEFHGHYTLADSDEIPFEIYVKQGHMLAALTVTSEEGATSGKSKITVTGYTLGSGESYVYQTAASTAPSVDYGDSVSLWTALTSGSEITPTASHTKITVAVKNSDGEAIGAGSATLAVKA